MRGVRKGRAGALAQILAALDQAGTEGLTVTELRVQLVDVSRSGMYTALHTAMGHGQVLIEKQHPIALYFGAGVGEADRRATFKRRARDIRQERSRAVSEGTLAAINGKRAEAGRPALPARTRSPAMPQRVGLPAVDPNALKPTATVTWPEGLRPTICPGYRSLSERLLANATPERLPPEPPSSWVQALLQSRGAAA